MRVKNECEMLPAGQARIQRNASRYNLPGRKPKMNISKRLRGASLVCTVLALSSTAFAQQTWKPERPVEIILGSAAGNSVDRMARTVQRMLQEKKLVETPISVANKPGGGNAVAWTYLNQRAGD